MNWPVIVAERSVAVAAVLRKHAPVTLEAPVQVAAEVKEMTRGLPDSEER